MKLLWCVVTWWLTLCVLNNSNAARVHAEPIDDPKIAATRSPRDVLLTAVIDAEINATREYVELLTAKAAVLERMIQEEQKHLDIAAATVPVANNTRSWHRPSSKRSNERFDDWVTAQGTWHSPPTTSATALHIELISFRPNGNIGGKRNSHASRSSPNDPMAPVVQFLLVINKETGLLELLHPVTQALMWQQRLEVPARIERVFFHSDRAAHLVLVTANDDVSVYKMRVFHSRRLVAGDYRRHSGRERAMCDARVSLPIGAYDAPHGQCPQHYPFVVTRYSRTIAPIGFHTHFEIEFDFIASSARKLSRATMVGSHQSLFLVTSSEDGHLGVFDGHNGSFIGEVSVPFGGEVGHFQPLSSGVLAFSVHNRIHFVDVFDRRLLGLTCEGSRHDITSLERDVWRHTVLYAGTSDGKGLVFRLNRFSSIKRNNGLMPIGADAINPFDEGDLGFPSCTLTALLQHRARVFDSSLQAKSTKPAIVTAMPGHVLLVTSDGHLVLYDTTSDASAPSYLSERSLEQALLTEQVRQVRVRSIQAGKDQHAGSVSVAVVLSDSRVELFAAHLTPTSSALDIGWIRAPMMLFCAFGVMFWQQNRFRRAPSAFDLDLPGAGPGRKRSRQYGRSGGSDWSSSTNHRVFSGR